MYKKSCLLGVLSFLLSFAFAQDMRYSEPVNEEFTRFFYDENYYLVDKNCEFKVIERVVQFDPNSLKFDGEFKDFNRFGKLILTGRYNKGIKQGKFTAYHPNGQIKWTSNFAENEPQGDWRYYYPDGKPMLTLSFEKEDFFFEQFWDQKGIQLIKDRVGEYKMTLPIIGYTDQGYSFFVRQGKIQQGKPHGRWTTSYVTDERKNILEPLFEEQFEYGEQISIFFNDSFLDEFLPEEDFVLVPQDYFPRAESMLIKGCNFDDYSGFYDYSRRKFQHYLDQIKFKPENRLLNFSMKYTVNKKGSVENLKLLESPINIKSSDRIKITEVFESMVYFIPSVFDNQTIRDEIIITISIEQTGEKLTLQNFNLKREKGQ